MLEVSVIAKTRSGHREFEPDPVPAVDSVREDLAMERNQKMPRDMVVGMNSPVYAGKKNSLTCGQTQAHRESSLCLDTGALSHTAK